MMGFINRIIVGYRNYIYNPLSIKRKFRKNHSRIKHVSRITNPECIECGKKVRILYGARIECFKKYANKQLYPRFLINDGVIIGPHFTALISDECSIGQNTIIAHNVTLVTSDHGMNPELSIPFGAQELSPKEIRIGKNCWIGCNVVFVRGGSIGDNSIVAAGSIVNKSFPGNVIIAGVPAKIIKKYDYNSHQWIRVDCPKGSNPMSLEVRND